MTPEKRAGGRYQLETGDPDIELMKYPANGLVGDVGPMYALRAHGMSVLVYLDAQGLPYVTVDRDEDAEWSPYSVQIEQGSPALIGELLADAMEDTDFNDED